MIIRTCFVKDYSIVSEQKTITRKHFPNMYNCILHCHYVNNKFISKTEKLAFPGKDPQNTKPYAGSCMTDFISHEIKSLI